MIVDRALVAEALPGYELGRELGRGASGLVVAGRHRRLGREVAIKILAAGSDGEDRIEQRFLAEAQVLSELDHPHIVRLHDYVEHRGLCLLVMERLSGGSLAARVPARAPVEYACGFGLAVSDALHAAHQRHILHRDIKPDNLLFAADGTVKVTDFGIAKLFEGSAAAASSFIGSPTYMAPEQASLGRLGPGTDLYSLGVVLYRLLTGHALFPRELPPAAMLLQHLSQPPPPMPGVPAEIEAVVLRALSKDIAERPPTARAFAFDLAAAAASELGPKWLSRARLPLRVDDQLRDAARWIGSPGQVGPERPVVPPSREPPTVDLVPPPPRPRPAPESAAVAAEGSTVRPGARLPPPVPSERRPAGPEPASPEADAKPTVPQRPPAAGPLPGPRTPAPVAGRPAPPRRSPERAPVPPPDERPTEPRPARPRGKERETPTWAEPVVVPPTPAWLRNPPPRRKIRRWLGRLLLLGFLALAAGGCAVWLHLR